MALPDPRARLRVVESAPARATADGERLKIPEGRYVLRCVEQVIRFSPVYGRPNLVLDLEVLADASGCSSQLDRFRVRWFGPLPSNYKRTRPGQFSKAARLWSLVAGRRLARGERPVYTIFASKRFRGTVKTVSRSWEKETGPDGRRRPVPLPDHEHYSIVESLTEFLG